MNTSRKQARALGRRIRHRREKLGWSQRVLAEKAGTTQQVIAKCEVGDVARPRRLPEIAQALSIDIMALIGRTREERRQSAKSVAIRSDLQLPSHLAKPAAERMSSKDIAELTGKLHKHVARDIKAMIAELHGSSPEEIEKDGPKLDHLIKSISWKKDARGYISEFYLDKRASYTLVTGYDVKRRDAVVRRWLELEEALVSHPSTDALAALNDNATLRQLLLGYTERVKDLEPKAKALDQIVKILNSF